MTTSRKNIVGEISGRTMVKNRRQKCAPSMAAASITERGTAWSAAKKNRKL